MIYIAPKSQKRIRAHWGCALGGRVGWLKVAYWVFKWRLNEDSVWDYTAECEEVRNSIFWELTYEKHGNQMKGCAVELKVYVSDYWLADERVDFIGMWYCKSSARYGGWPVYVMLCRLRTQVWIWFAIRWEPVELSEKFGRCQGTAKRGLLCNDSSKCVLCSLKTSYMLLWTTK